MSHLQSDEQLGAPPADNQQAVLSQLDSRVNKRQYVHALKFEFPFKLHELLEDATRDGNEHIVSWHPDGKAFTIHLKQEFETQIIPQYFPKAPKYRSFCRQLSIYGYKMDQDASSKYFRAYRHPLMVRGNPGLCARMVRETVKGSSYRHPLMVRGKPGLCARMVREKVKGSSSSKTRISERAACSRSQQQQKYKMEDESFVQQEEETTTDHPVSILHGGGVSLSNVLHPISPPIISGRKKAAAQEMSSSLITAVQEGEGALLQFAIAANAYLEDSSSAEISSPVAAIAKHPHPADDFVSTTTSTVNHMLTPLLQENPATKMIFQEFNDDPLFLEAPTWPLMMSNNHHDDLQGSESMVLDAIRQLLPSPHRQSISSASFFRSS